MRQSLLTVALMGLFLTAGPAVSAADHVMAMRMTSLDAVLADGERIAAAAGQTESRKELLADAMAPIGLTDTEWVDRSRPIVVSVPPEGMAFMGWVAAVPVTDVQAALAGLEAQLEGHEFVEGVHSYVTLFKSRIFVAPAEGYFVTGLNRDLVAAADLKKVLDVGELPPGNVAFDIDLVPMTAMIQLGLAMGRQALVPGDEEDEEEAAAARANLSMFDLYIELVNNMILNTSRVQLSIETGSEYMMLHKRLLPRDDSTLAGLLDVQKGGFPDLGRRMAAEPASAVMAANVTLTPAFREAVKTFLRHYFDAMKSLGEATAEGEADWFGAMMAPWEETMEQWVDCMRGDTVASYDFSAEIGIRVAQLTGLTDGEACAELVGEMANAMGQLRGFPEGESPGSVEHGAVVHAGVTATRVSVGLLPPGAGDEAADAESLEMMKRLFGGDSYVHYMGVSGDVLLSTSGAQAEEGFKAAVDRVSVRKKRGGMTARQFEPLIAGPGVYAAVDMARVFRQLAEMDPDDSDLQQLRGFSDAAGKVVVAARMLPGSLDINLGMPLALFEVIEELNDADEEDEGDSDSHATGDGAPKAEVSPVSEETRESKPKP